MLLNTAHRTPVNCERCRSDRAATRETGCSRGPPDKTLWWNGKSVRNDFADSFALFSNHWGMARFTGLESPAQKRVLWTRTNTLREGEKGLSADSVLFWSQSTRLNQTSFSRDSVKITSQRSRWCRMTSFRWTGKVLKRLIWNWFYSSSWCWKVWCFLQFLPVQPLQTRYPAHQLQNSFQNYRKQRGKSNYFVAKNSPCTAHIHKQSENPGVPAGWCQQTPTLRTHHPQQHFIWPTTTWFNLDEVGSRNLAGFSGPELRLPTTTTTTTHQLFISSI